ncbi:G2/M phase-specific E3 ubiquitin-protein ligase-like [Acipenser ruthenus]|uniref:G2/M phase-specific E3 ubiquitin-protein ligase-like n=1 Tax=Acipenser ruthenus TaxID=7906 RepID=UPI002740FFAA|nr:G2/M phase-specific E3 ubiquitin-protein ligase-like [Acipenser ruthenus]
MPQFPGLLIVQVNGSMLLYLLMKSSVKALKIQYPFPLVVKHPTMNVMVSDDYFYAGMTIATSLVHGGPGPQFLSPVLFEALSSTPESIFVAGQDIPDMDIRNYLEKLLTYQDEHSNTANLFEPIQTLIQLAGTHKVIRNADDYRKIAEETAHWYIFGRTQAAFERYTHSAQPCPVLLGHVHLAPYMALFCPFLPCPALLGHALRLALLLILIKQCKAAM